MTPAVSVLLPVFNGERYLGEAIESILRQTFQHWELIIIDDGSTDGSAEIAEGLRDERIRLLRNERNVGLTRTLNRGLREARGTLIARQDADDASHPERLQRQVARLGGDPELALVGARPRLIDDTGRRIGVACTASTWPALLWSLAFDNPFTHSSVMFRRAVALDTLGGYDESFAFGQDYELWSRMMRAGHRLENLPEELVNYRVHQGSMTATMRDAAWQEARAVVPCNLSCIFSEKPLSGSERDEALELILGMRFMLPPTPSGNRWDAFHRLLVRFCECHPEATLSRDFRAVTARQKFVLGLYHTGERPVALGRILRAWMSCIRGVTPLVLSRAVRLTRWLR